MNKNFSLNGMIVEHIKLKLSSGHVLYKKHKSEHKSHKINKSPEVRERKLNSS